MCASAPARRQRTPAFCLAPSSIALRSVPLATSRAPAAPPPRAAPSLPPRQSRFLKPVPPPRPEEILPRKRGRNGLKRVHQAEHFRQYIYLRRQLKPWSDAFRKKHGRTPSLVDVHQSNVPGLLDRFVEYLEALDRLRE